MTARERVSRARRALLVVAGVRVALVTVTVLFLVLWIGVAADWAFAVPRTVRSFMLPVAVVLGIAGGGWLAWRMRGLGSLQRVALWIEERHPSGWALVTALDPRFAGHPEIEHAARDAHDGALLGRTALRALVTPLGLALIGGGLLNVVPEAARERVTAPRSGDVLARSHRNPLDVWVVEVDPPAYTRLPSRTLESPASVDGLEGSRVRVSGRGSGVGCVGHRAPCTVHRGMDSWTVTLVMPDSGEVLALSADSVTRLIALLPRRDSLPVVLLRAPERDTVLREPTGTIALAAEVRDDFGVTDARFEYVISSGFGESYTFRDGESGRRTGGQLEGALDLDSLAVRPGDVIHLRAVARDAGPTHRGLGVSSTRAIRIAREGEYDLVSTILLPALPPDTSALSQRLLIQLTEALIARMPRLARDAVLVESQAIGRDQTRLRRQVGDVIFMRLGDEGEAEHSHEEDVGDVEDMTPEQLLAAAEAATGGDSVAVLDFHGDETPVVAINRPLLEAYNAMWDASRELAIGDPESALPHMYAALDAIQRARAAERIYLRGRPRVAVLDVDAIRLAGNRSDADPVRRSPGEVPTRRVALDRMLANVGRVDSLLLLRVELLDTEPEAAAALGDAVGAMRAGRSPADALVRARAALAGGVRPASNRWGAW